MKNEKLWGRFAQKIVKIGNGAEWGGDRAAAPGKRGNPELQPVLECPESKIFISQTTAVGEKIRRCRVKMGLVEGKLGCG